MAARSPLAAVIPAFNVASAIGAVVRGAREAGLDVIVVDDGSVDQTARVAEEHGATVLRHPCNRGKGSALRTGFARALREGRDAVITLDGDGQHDPAEIPRFCEARERTGIEVLVGARERDQTAMPLDRRFSNWATSGVLSWRVGQSIPDSQSGFRCIDARVLAAVPLKTRRYQAESELLIRAALAGFRIGFVPISTIYGEESSHIRKLRDTWNFVWLVARSLAW